MIRSSLWKAGCVSAHVRFGERGLETYRGNVARRHAPTPLLTFDRTASNHFFQVINQAYERQSVIITSNRPFQEWSGVFHDPVIVTAILDRLLHHAHLFNLKGDSYRLRDHIKVHGQGVSPVA